MHTTVNRLAALTSLVIATCLCGGLVSAQQASPSAQKPTPAFRAGVDVVSLNVTVTDGMNRFVTDLELPEFSVFEDGVKQDVTFFNRRQHRSRCRYSSTPVRAWSSICRRFRPQRQTS